MTLNYSGLLRYHFNPMSIALPCLLCMGQIDELDHIEYGPITLSRCVSLRFFGVDPVFKEKLYSSPLHMVCVMRCKKIKSQGSSFNEHKFCEKICKNSSCKYCSECLCCNCDSCECWLNY
jgi:hypothetical protein